MSFSKRQNLKTAALNIIEASDIIDSVYRSLPQDFQGMYDTMHQRAVAALDFAKANESSDGQEALRLASKTLNLAREYPVLTHQQPHPHPTSSSREVRQPGAPQEAPRHFMDGRMGTSLQPEPHVISISVPVGQWPPPGFGGLGALPGPSTFSVAQGPMPNMPSGWYSMAPPLPMSFMPAPRPSGQSAPPPQVFMQPMPPFGYPQPNSYTQFAGSSCRHGVQTTTLSHRTSLQPVLYGAIGLVLGILLTYGRV